jgi:flagellin
MSMRINHNILSMTARRHLNTNQLTMDTAVNRLSSGLRINQAWEDPSGLAVSEKFRAQIASMTEAERNANYAINLLATAEGALSVIDEKLIRMRALSIQASNGTLTSTDRSYINTEFQQLKSEVTRIANVTNYNGLYLIDGSYSSGSGNSIKFHIGTHNVSNEDFYFVNIASMTASALGLSGASLTTTASAQSAIGLLDSAINTKDSERTAIGSYVERLQNTILNLQISAETATASESTIRDADMAYEMSSFVRSQILMQTGVSMLAQANQLPMLVANLIA